MLVLQLQVCKNQSVGSMKCIVACRYSSKLRFVYVRVCRLDEEDKLQLI
jgi:hypothetical protein